MPAARHLTLETVKFGNFVEVDAFLEQVMAEGLRRVQSEGAELEATDPFNPAPPVAQLSSDNQGSKDLACEKHTKASKGAATGAPLGAVFGAALAWLVSIQTVTITGLMPFVAAGPLVAAVAGAGAGGALGWIAGLLAGLRRTEYVGKQYAGRIRRGGILLSVHCDSPQWCDRAKKTLKDTGARNISSASEAAADYGDDG